GSLRDRDDRRHPLDEGLALPRGLAAPSPSGAAPDRALGGAPRDPIRLRADPGLRLPPRGRPGTVVGRRAPGPEETASRGVAGLRSGREPAAGDTGRGDQPAARMNDVAAASRWIRAMSATGRSRERRRFSFD